MPDPVLNPQMPWVKDPEELKSLQKEANKKINEKHADDVRDFPQDKVAAYHWFSKRFVGEKTPMQNLLIGHLDYAGMISTKSYCATRVAKAIRYLLITNRRGEKNTPLNSSLTKDDAIAALYALRIGEYKDFD